MTDVATIPVSVVIPAYDRAAQIEVAVACVLAQRGVSAAEILVVDDASTDGTAAAAERAGATVLRLASNSGPSGARNAGLRAATQPWVAFLDSDDEWLPKHLATLWASASEGHSLVAAAAMRCGPRDARRFHGTVSAAPRLLASPRDLIVPENCVPTSATMVRRDLALEVGGFDESERHAEDLDLWIRLLERRPGMVIPKVTVRYNIHEGQLSGASASMRRARVRFIEAYAGRPWWSRTLMERARGGYIWDELRADLSDGCRRPALRNAARLAVDPRRAVGALEVLRFRRQVRARSVHGG